MKLHAFLRYYFPMLPRYYQRNMLLNGYEPAMTQLSRMCLSATVSQYVRHSRIAALVQRYGEDGAADYIWSHYAYAMAHFLKYKVGPGSSYNRQYNFFTNVRSSVLSVHAMVDTKYKRRYGCGLESLNDMVGNGSDRTERMNLLTSKDRMLPRSRPVRESDNELCTVLEDKEEMQCGFYG